MLETAANYYISNYYHLAARCGLDAAALLEQVGLQQDVIDAPERRVEAEKLAKFALGVWDALQDEAMSLSESPVPRGSFYMMGKLTVHEPNLRKALEQIIRFYGLVTRAFTMDLRIEGDKALLSSVMHYQEMDAAHLHAEINMMGWHRYASWLIAENIPLIDVYFSYPAPPHVSEYSYLFPGRHVFDAPNMGFSFHKHYLDRENVQSAQSLKAFMRRCPVELFLQPQTDFSLSSDIQRYLNRNIKNGVPTVDQAADHLHMTRRTLIRKLKEEGTSYQQVKDLVRRDRAINYLSRQAISVAEVAEKLGYSDPAVFARAFKSWTGLSPRDYRGRHSQL